MKSSTLSKVADKLKRIHQRHQERHRPTGYGFAFADRVDYLRAEAWDAVVQDAGVFLRRDVLRVIEEHGPENVTPRYALVFKDREPVAAVAAQVVSVRGDQLRSDRKPAPTSKTKGLIRRAFRPAAQAAADRIHERILVAGNLLSWGFHGIAFAPHEDPVSLWPGVAEALYRIRRSEKLNGQANWMMVKDLTPAQAGVNKLETFSFRPLETEPNMVLTLNPDWNHYDDYLAALDAKYRRNAKDQIKKLQAAGCSVEQVQDLRPIAARLHELYCAVQSNASVRLVTIRNSYLPGLAGALSDSFRCTVIRRGDQILGFVTSLRDGPTAIGYYIGFDREAAAEGLPLYLRLLHSTIGDAIAWKCTKLSLGRTALEPKAALGAKPEAMSVWMRHRVPALNWTIRGLLGAIPHADAPERNPFKNVATQELTAPCPKGARDQSPG